MPSLASIPLGDPPLLQAGTVTFQPNMYGDTNIAYWGVGAITANEQDYYYAQLPGLPLIAIVPGEDDDETVFHEPYPSRGQWDPTPVATGNPDEWTKQSKVRVRDTQMDYIFESTRTGTEYVNRNTWLNEDLPLKAIRHWDGSTYDYTVLSATETEINGRHLPGRWTDGSDSSKYIDFEYDSGGILTKAVASHGAAIDMTYSDIDYEYYFDEGGFTQTLTNEWVQLDSVSSSCESCPEYTYEYDLDQLTKVLDGDNNVLVAHEYVDYLFARGGEGVRLTKMYRQPTGSPVQNLFEAVYDITGAGTDAVVNSITHYTFATNSSTQVEVEHLDAGQVTAVDYYKDLSPTIGTSAKDTVTYSYQYNDAPVQLTKSTVTYPAGNKAHSYHGTSGVEYEAITKKTLVGFSSNETTIAEYTYGVTNVMTHPVTMTGIRGGVTDYQYDGFGRVTRQIEPNVASVGRLTTEYEYDADGTLTKTGEGESGSFVYTENEYDLARNLTKSTEDTGGLNLATSYAYDDANKLTMETDPRGIQRVSGYTPSGTLTRTYTLAEGSATQAVDLTVYEYDSLARLTKTKIADSEGLISSPTTDPSGMIETTYEYDAFGRRTKEIVDPTGEDLATTYEFDHQDRVTKTTASDSTYTVVERDGRGRRIRQIIGYTGGGSAAELTTLFAYDSNGHLTLQTAPDGVRTAYDYDGYDRLKSRGVYNPN